MHLADYIGKYWAGAEVMYGVIIAMSFTSVFRGNALVFESMLYKTIFAALFCCIAWGIADGLFYIWERRYNIKQENNIIQFSKLAQQNESAIHLIEEQLDDTILRNLNNESRQQLYKSLVQYLSKVDIRASMSSHETLIIIISTFMLSAGAGLIVVIPFFVISNVEQALDISNMLGILLLFGAGYFRALERSLFSKITYGFGSALIGIIIVVITIVLGG
ncbi:MAG: hypothetical protein MUO26_13610 [Methanotrichaceae archaeon]|nr:hypothetical protein [Methanotrichaceae archaeon]